MSFRAYLRWEGALAVVVGVTLCAFGWHAGHQSIGDSAMSGLLMLTGTGVFLALRHRVRFRAPGDWFTARPLAVPALTPPCSRPRLFLALIGELSALTAATVGLSILTGYWLTYVDFGVWLIAIGVIKIGPAVGAVERHEASSGSTLRVARRRVRGFVEVTAHRAAVPGPELAPGPGGEDAAPPLEKEEVAVVLGRAVVAQGNPAKVDEVVAFVRDRVQPLADSLPGSLGLSMLVNRDTGMVVVNSVWSDEAALAASDDALRDVRQEALSMIGAPAAEIHVIEPAVIFQSEPDRPGFWTRATEIQEAPERMDQQIATFRDVVMPAIREHFAGANTIGLMVDRKTGYAVANISYTSREAMEATRGAADRLRSESVRDEGAEVLRVLELEIAIVGIRPPIDMPAQGRPVEFPSSLRR